MGVIKRTQIQILITKNISGKLLILQKQGIRGLWSKTLVSAETHGGAVTLRSEIQSGLGSGHPAP